jgi:hypothetical protein
LAICLNYNGEVDDMTEIIMEGNARGAARMSGPARVACP